VYFSLIGSNNRARAVSYECEAEEEAGEWRMCVWLLGRFGGAGLEQGCGRVPKDRSQLVLLGPVLGKAKTCPDFSRPGLLRS
jgi:hypothetical protein